jgi:P-type Cu+ transporter
MKIKKLKLKITGMHCVSCAMNIDGDLEDYVKGVKSSSTNYAKQECIVEYDEQKTGIEKILKQVEKTGYTAQAAIE